MRALLQWLEPDVDAEFGCSLDDRWSGGKIRFGLRGEQKVNGTHKREAAAAVIPCFELRKVGGGSDPELVNARKVIRAAIAKVEAVHGGDTAAKDAAAEIVGSRIGGDIANGSVTPGMLQSMDDATCAAAGDGYGAVAAGYIAGVEAGA